MRSILPLLLTTLTCIVATEQHNESRTPTSTVTSTSTSTSTSPSPSDVASLPTWTLLSTLWCRFFHNNNHNHIASTSHDIMLHTSYLPFLIVLLLPVLYYQLTRGNVKEKRNFLSKDQSNRFLAMRRAAFPPPYPNGWWKVCDVADLDNGRIQSVTALGQDIVIFKGADGKIGALNAFCPHMGAHLGAGSQVVGNTLRCAFHGWSFSADGVCQHIPYSTSCEPPPTSTHARTWRTCIWMRMVFIWFHADNEEPTYELEQRPIMENEWVDYTCIQTEFEMHISEMAENSADYYHFNYLHAPLPIPIIGRFFTVRHETELFFPKETGKDHICYFDDWGEIWLFNRIRLGFTRQVTRVTFEGPSIVHFDIDSPLGHMHLIKTLLPLEPFKQYTEDRWFIDRRTPRWLIKIVATIAKGALEQDRVVWENRRYNNKPVLVKGDGPFPVHRRWWQQFYSASSNDVGKFTLEW